MPDLNVYKKQQAHVIGEDYGMFPDNDMRFEITNTPDEHSWGFFANKSNRTVCHIKFNLIGLVDDL